MAGYVSNQYGETDYKSEKYTQLNEAKIQDIFNQVFFYIVINYENVMDKKENKVLEMQVDLSPADTSAHS